MVHIMLKLSANDACKLQESSSGNCTLANASCHVPVHLSNQQCGQHALVRMQIRMWKMALQTANARVPLHQKGTLLKWSDGCARGAAGAPEKHWLNFESPVHMACRACHTGTGMLTAGTLAA